jgi:hypothetical protein
MCLQSMAGLHDLQFGTSLPSPDRKEVSELIEAWAADAITDEQDATSSYTTYWVLTTTISREAGLRHARDSQRLAPLGSGAVVLAGGGASDECLRRASTLSALTVLAGSG